MTTIAIIIFVGYVVLLRGSNFFQSEKTANTENIAGETSVQTPSNSPSITPSVFPTISPKPITSSSSSSPSSQKFIYPGADGQGSHYQTNDAGDTVYNWYKAEMEKNTYQIRTNVKTRANDKFKAVLQGASGNDSFKVTIDQENSSAKTVITIE